MADFTTTTTSAVIEDVVSNMVQETLIQKAVVVPSVSDFSAMIRPGMDRLGIPRQTQLTVQDITEGSEVTPATSTVSVDDLLLDKNKAITWAITDLSGLQSKPDMLAWLLKDNMASLAEELDDNVVQEIRDNISASAPDHRVAMAGSTLTLAEIVNAKQLLDTQKLPQADRFLMVGPAQVAGILQISNFIQADQFGSNEHVVNGLVGRILGFDVIMTTAASLLSDEAIFYHKSCCAFGRQQNVRFERERRATYFKDDYALSQVYGAKFLDGGKRAVLYNNDGL